MDDSITPRPASTPSIQLIEQTSCVATRSQVARLRSRHPHRLPWLESNVLADMAELRARCDRRSPALRVCVLDLGDLVVVGLDGELSSATGPFLRERLRAELDPDVRSVAFDCSLLTSMTRAGAAVLAGLLSDRRALQVTIREPNQDVLGVLQEAGLLDDHRVELERDG